MRGVWFDNVHSYDDFNVVLSEVSIPPATPKTNFVDIPGGDGSVDQSEAQGEIRFNDRECSFTFTTLPTDDQEEKKQEISNAINGKRCKIRLDKDPDYYWYGRCWIDEYKSNKNINSIVVKARVAPYKLKLNPTTVTVAAGTDVVKLLGNSRKTVVPTITTTAAATVVHNGNTYSLGAGNHKILNIQLVQGENQVTVTSTAPVVFTYQEGDL